MPSPPILFITFDRFDITKRVFEHIRQAKPERLYLVSDGAVPQKKGQEEKVRMIRDYLSNSIDWTCSVKKLYRDKNWGVDINIPDAVNWFFENEESGIILEDDCLPDPTFFQFCGELLEHYKNNDSVFMISGDRFLKNRKAVKESYTFSGISYSWGWATWRDRWKKIEPIMGARNEISAQLLPAMLKGTPRQFWDNQIVVAHQGKSTWDVDWQLALWANDGAAIQPVHNLITNIGITGTHMKPYDPCINLPTRSMPFPLIHPDAVEVSEKHDLRTEKLIRRSAVKNIELILKYALSLPFRSDETILGGTKKLFHSLATEMKSKNG